MSVLALARDPVWQATAASARGASHDRSGSPNQDSGRTVLIGDGSGAVIAVADGHGDSLHARSDRGSRFAIEAAFEVLTNWIASASGSEDAIRRSAEQLPEAILASWRGKVTSDLDSDVPGEAETASLSSEKIEYLKRSPELLYGSTLVAAAIGDRFAAYVQIGDGDLLIIGQDDRVSRVVPGRDDLPISRTESLCQEDASKRFRVAVEFFGTRSRPQFVMASTDGYVNSYPGDDAAFLKVATDIKRYLEQDGLAWVEQHVESWLKQTTKTGSGDDITLALAWSGSQKTAPERAKPRRARRYLAIGVLVVALCVPLAWAGRDWVPAGWMAYALELARAASEKTVKILHFPPKAAPAGKLDTDGSVAPR
jgi:serine/threonine protein phosphatase PrpC